MKYKFVKKGTDRNWLLCPHCNEENSYYDVEIYPKCPFCNGELEKNGELEDFILEPLVSQWTYQCNIDVASNPKAFSRGVN
ncbi:MAG: hypothetical protein L3J71_12445 [Victivallaceae bacterium]|nr:hypothetical protein [Victivallaceae bacterium]